MGSEKLSISLDADLLALVRAFAAERGMSISTWLAKAAEAQIRQMHLRVALDAAQREFGKLDDDEIDRLIAEARKTSIVVHGGQGATA